jgi:signal transduction histidine kinase
MSIINPPVPFNEMERIINLSEFNLDYSDLESNFKDLAILAAKIAGTPVSLINLVDAYTQWTVISNGTNLTQMPREDSVCQFAIMNDEAYEVKDLAADERFADKFYVNGDFHLRYYLGIPLKTEEGYQIGALCVMDTNSKNSGLEKEISPEKIELLSIIAAEIVQRLKALSAIKLLREQLHQANDVKKKVVHDIRGPIGGIIGLARIISEQGKSNTIDEVLDFISLIQQSGSSLLELADEILSSETKEKEVVNRHFNMSIFKEKLLKLYLPQAINKNINFTVNVPSEKEKIPFFKDKLLQIIGNLISNAMKFTPQNGFVSVSMDFAGSGAQKLLKILVTDSGVGLSLEAISVILDGQATSTEGTGGEKGYGFGLALVKHLVDKLNGTIIINSIEGEGTTFEISVPQTSEVVEAPKPKMTVV